MNYLKSAKRFLFKNIKSLLAAIVVIGLFIFSSWLARAYSDELAGSAFSMNFYGELAYFLVSILSVVIAGLSSSPLIPLAATLWGPLLAVMLTSVGWTIGSLIAFWLARRWGERLVCRLVNKCDFDDFRSLVKPRRLFWQLLLARIFLPVDILSYAVGLFTKMPWKSFLFSTLIGSAIFAALAVKAAQFPVKYQIAFGVLLLFVFFFRTEKLIKNIIARR